MLNMKIKDGQFDTAFYLTLVDIAMKAAEVGADIVTIRGPEVGGCRSNAQWHSSQY